MKQKQQNIYMLLANHFVWITLVCLFVSYGFSQQLTAYFNKERIKIGEPVELKLIAQVAENSSIFFNAQENEIAIFNKNITQNDSNTSLFAEIFNEFHDTIKKSGKSITWIGNYTLVFWDTGRMVVPAIQIFINDSSFYFEETSIKVLSETIGNQDELFDIEEGFVEIQEKSTLAYFFEDYWHILLSIVVLLLVILVYFFRKKKKTVQPLKVMSLKERTLFAINTLEKQKLWLDGKTKQHYTELSHIMRSYLSSRYELNLLERTTFETRVLLSQLDLSKETIETLMIILQQADMVKFANSDVDELNIFHNLSLCKQIVVETSPIEIQTNEKVNKH